MLNVCCVNAGDYLGRGDVYVRCLYQGVRANLNPDSYRFTVFADGHYANGDGYWSDDLVIRPLPHPGLKGWMNKLALFKRGVFADGDKNLYLDLDTIISGGLDEIAAYDGPFAMLEDMYYPTQLGSGVMAWCAGFGEHVIWDNYLAAGCPDFQGGDQAWIQMITRERGDRVDRLQDLYPGQIASYKVSRGVLAPQTRIVCFHGNPRPHDVDAGWVPIMWNR